MSGNWYTPTELRDRSEAWGRRQQARLWTLDLDGRPSTLGDRVAELFGVTRVITDVERRWPTMWGLDVIDTKGVDRMLVFNGKLLLDVDWLLHKARVLREVRAIGHAAAPDLYAYIGEA